MTQCRWTLLAITPKPCFLIKLTLHSSPICHSYWFCPIMWVLPKCPLKVPPNVAVMAFLWNLYKKSCLPGSLKNIEQVNRFPSCQMGFVPRRVWSERTFKVKTFIRLKLHTDVSSFSLASHLLFLHLPIILPHCIPTHYVCLARMLLCVDLFYHLSSCLLCVSVVFLSIQSFLFTLGFLFRKRKLLPIMTTAEESMTMTSDSNVI